MDGASRFTQRDAVASILITGINIIAGFLIGVLQHGMDLRKALETYTVLTIGDGLVTVIPALMISISGGLIVTRASSDAPLGAEFQKQILATRSRCCWRRASCSRWRCCPACRSCRSCCWAAARERPAGGCGARRSAAPAAAEATPSRRRRRRTWNR